MCASIFLTMIKDEALFQKLQIDRLNKLVGAIVDELNEKF